MVDNFAGGGGAGEAIEQVMGHNAYLSINHDSTAIAVHTPSHSGDKHSVADLRDVEP